MLRTTRTLAVGNAYGAMLERLMPRLEQLLLGKLERLEAVVAFEESLQSGNTSAISSRTVNRSRSAAADPSPGRPSVIVLRARLKTARKHCSALIRRVTSLFHADSRAS